MRPCCRPCRARDAGTDIAGVRCAPSGPSDSRAAAGCWPPRGWGWSSSTPTPPTRRCSTPSFSSEWSSGSPAGSVAAHPGGSGMRCAAHGAVRGPRRPPRRHAVSLSRPSDRRACAAPPSPPGRRRPTRAASSATFSTSLGAGGPVTEQRHRAAALIACHGAVGSATSCPRCSAAPARPPRPHPRRPHLPARPAGAGAV